MSEVRQGLLDKVFQSCLQEYADKQSTFAQIDNKAQTTASVAGVLIAAALAFVQADSVQAHGELGRAEGSRLVCVRGRSVTRLDTLLFAGHENQAAYGAPGIERN